MTEKDIETKWKKKRGNIGRTLILDLENRINIFALTVCSNQSEAEKAVICGFGDVFGECVFFGWIKVRKIWKLVKRFA